MIDIGFDTEFALLDKETFEPISAVGKVGGTKENPLPIEELFSEERIKELQLSGFLVQEDNVNVELNTPVAKNSEQLGAILKGHSDLAFELANKIGTVLPCFSKSALWYPSSELNTLAAQTFGCDPDFNAWTGQQNKSPKRETNLRTIGCHIHIGYESPSLSDTIEIVKWLDVTLGLGVTAWGSQRARITLYGRPGSFRPKDYGLEYRFLPSIFCKIMSLSQQYTLRSNSAVLSESISSSESKSKFLFLLISEIVSIVKKGITVEKATESIPELLKLIRISMAMGNIDSAFDIINGKSYKNMIMNTFPDNDFHQTIPKLFGNVAFNRRFI